MYSETFSAKELSGARGGICLFDSVSFDLGPGDAVLLRGPNGSGKSTLLRILAGLLPALGGAVRFGQPDEELPLCHFLGHANAIKHGLTVEQNVRFWVGFARAAMVRAAREDAIDDALAAFNLDRLRDMPARYLSAGQKRRLALARLVASPASLWLLDEPVTALDAASVHLFEQAVADHRGMGGIAIIATHQDLDVPDASALRLGRTG